MPQSVHDVHLHMRTRPQADALIHTFHTQGIRIQAFFVDTACVKGANNEQKMTRGVPLQQLMVADGQLPMPVLLQLCAVLHLGTLSTGRTFVQPPGQQEL